MSEAKSWKTANYRGIYRPLGSAWPYMHGLAFKQILLPRYFKQILGPRESSIWRLNMLLCPPGLGLAKFSDWRLLAGWSLVGAGKLSPSADSRQGPRGPVPRHRHRHSVTDSSDTPLGHPTPTTAPLHHNPALHCT